jgi:regulator of protease activity HflC (stomatin/prohibitin superfamily)
VQRLKQPRFWFIAGGAVAGLALLALGWWWCFWRVEVPPGYSLVRIHQWGKDLPDDVILAPDESYKGVLVDMLPEGRYFLNPWAWRTELVPMVEVPTDKVLVLTRKYGKPIPPERMATGDFLARDGERGIVAEVLRPGKHRLNPYAYQWELRDVVRIGSDEVGVCTLKVGTDPTDVKGDRRTVYVVPEGTRGVQEKYLPGGVYYINPYVKSIVPVKTRSQEAEFKDIEFPSKDGFYLRPHVTVTYKVLEDKAPELFVTLSDKGSLPQGYQTPEEQARNPILQKVVLPLIRGAVRIEGSKMEARDFVAQSGPPDARRDVGLGVGLAACDLVAPVGNPRELLQQVLMKKVAPACNELGIVIQSVRVGQSEKDADLAALADLITAREQARLQRDQNAALVQRYQQDAKTKGTEALNQQKVELRVAQTKLDVAKTEAEQRTEVEKLKLEQEKKNAKLLLEAARKEAEATVSLGQAEAAVITKQNEAEVAALKTSVQGFSSAQQYAQYMVLLRLAPALKEVFASDTGDFAKLFAGYMTPPAGKLAAAPAPGGPPPATPAMPPAGDR